MSLQKKCEEFINNIDKNIKLFNPFTDRHIYNPKTILKIKGKCSQIIATETKSISKKLPQTKSSSDVKTPQTKSSSDVKTPKTKSSSDVKTPQTKSSSSSRSSKNTSDSSENTSAYARHYYNAVKIHNNNINLTSSSSSGVQSKSSSSRVQSKSSSTSLNYTQYDVKGDGSCFFRALFCSLKINNMLENFMKCLFVDESILPDEDAFVQLIRYYYSDKILNDENLITTNLYAYLKEQYEKDRKTYSIITRNSIPWMNELKNFPKFDKFKEMFANKLKQTSYWIGAWEYEFLQTQMKKCTNMIIYIFNDRIDEDFIFKQNTVYLINLNEKHYNYIIPKVLI
jgi:hypothetical protein